MVGEAREALLTVHAEEGSQARVDAHAAAPLRYGVQHLPSNHRRRSQTVGRSNALTILANYTAPLRRGVQHLPQTQAAVKPSVLSQLRSAASRGPDQSSNHE